MSEYKFKVVEETWSGHGEGGTVVRVVLDKVYGLYDATPEAIAEARRDCDRLNETHESS